MERLSLIEIVVDKVKIIVSKPALVNNLAAVSVEAFKIGRCRYELKGCVKYKNRVFDDRQRKLGQFLDGGPAKKSLGQRACKGG